MKSELQEKLHYESLVRKPEVMKITGLSHSTLYYFMNQGTFPTPVRIGTRTVAWRESEIMAWINSREKISFTGAESWTA